MSAKRVLITGGTGFLGAYIIKELVMRGYHVRGIRRSAKLPAYISSDILSKVEWVEGDVLDVISLEEAMAGIDIVIHSAAVVSFSKKDRASMYRINVDGTANVVNTALDSGIKRFVHISSVAALGRTTSGGTVDEEKKWEESKANTHYSKSKHKAELEVWRGMGEGLNGVILNPSTILGYGDWHNSSGAIFRNIYNEFKWYTPGLNSFVDVEDVARATVLLMESNITEQRYIVSSESWPFKRLLETIADNFGKKRPAKQATRFLMGIAWRLERVRSFFSRRKPSITRETVTWAFSKTNFDNQKILKALPGFTFTPLDQAIQKACRLYLSHIKQ